MIQSGYDFQSLWRQVSSNRTVDKFVCTEHYLMRTMVTFHQREHFPWTMAQGWDLELEE